MGVFTGRGGVKGQDGGVAHVCSEDILKLEDEESGLIWEIEEEEVSTGRIIEGEEKEGEKKT